MSSSPGAWDVAVKGPWPVLVEIRCGIIMKDRLCSKPTTSAVVSTPSGPLLMEPSKLVDGGYHGDAVLLNDVDDWPWSTRCPRHRHGVMVVQRDLMAKVKLALDEGEKQTYMTWNLWLDYFRDPPRPSTTS